jgi:hypothetical protein
MKRQFLALLMLAALLVCLPMSSAEAGGGFGGRGGHRGRGPASFRGLGFGGGFGYGGWDISELYRQLYNNLPYFALHPPVYYSYPVPRTYGYGPFAYPPSVMTPDVAGGVQPMEIINPYVPSVDPKPASLEKDRTTATSSQPQPLVIINPYVTPNRAVAKSQQ